ncbi:Fructose dehydrogenase large subunit [Labeo rohita]|uniref:Fructose dehydrogenase large subunit n=1 Tax=Labeo rohita TaxID=84645 RepID=A0ABQ8LB65_LABRO|nr:Fructose dehydrogenase large subunit [Labeo rohita]
METPYPVSPADLETFRGGSGRPVCLSKNIPLPVVLFPDRRNVWCGGTVPPVSLLTQTLCKITEDEEQVLLVAPYWPTRTWFPELILLVTAPPWRIPLRKDLLTQRGDTLWHPCPDLWKLHVWSRVPSRDQICSFQRSGRHHHFGESSVHETCFEVECVVEWCSSHQEDPRRCPISRALLFAARVPQGGKKAKFAPAPICTLLGSVPAVVPTALRQAPFEPLQSVELKFLSMKTLLLSMKTLLLLALASVKRVGDLHTFSVDESCLEVGPADSQVILRPRAGYVPKVPTTLFRDQVVSLQALPPEKADPALALLCPVRALRWYVDRTQSFRTSDQLFVCFGGRQKGNAISKQRMAQCIVDAITLAYQAQGVPCPLRLLTQLEVLHPPGH